MFIGTKIKDLRKTQKMTLTELSQKSGVQLATLSRIEHMKMVKRLLNKGLSEARNFFLYWREK